MPEDFTDHFDQLYRDYYVKVYRLALGLTHKLNDAEDITQETFLRAFRSYHTFREESSFFTWIYRIAVNVANDYMKQRKKLYIYEIAEEAGCSVEELADPHPANNPETKLMVNEVMRYCMAAFTECLPINQRKVFFLAAGLGLPHKLVAEIMDCSVSSVKSSLYRAKNRIVGFMENRCQLVRKSNPCRCEQWVKRGISRGWITKECVTNPRPRITIPEKVKIYMRDVRDIYKNVYLADNDETLAKYIKEGFAQKRWATFS
ncbi:MAG: RNA polymerase sigma factor [Firmicutes bacterium HGW-Firmicutes-14]|nr:MAG: RNA polymerase sigma factor [Firmicutes bacterium HGW-Firmicutes-14]